MNALSDSQAPRVALYSHDTLGLGHMRRNYRIAQALVASPVHPTVLLIAGAREASVFPAIPGVDVLTLPSYSKEGRGTYGARSLEISHDRLVSLRAGVIEAALDAFAPDVFIVDKVPRGIGGELDRTLENLRASRRTRCVLGLRDVLDEPCVVRAEWREQQSEQAIRRFFDAVWVYGDPTVYDPVREYGFSKAVKAKVQYTGYLNGRHSPDSAAPVRDDSLARLGLSAGRFVLCALGGGADGRLLADAFVASQLPPNTNGVLLTGPFMSPEVRDRLHHRASAYPRLRVLEFETRPEALLDRSDRVIAMGGYNTICEVVSYRKKALIVPRVEPRNEQWIRAHRFQELGLIDMVHPGSLSSEFISQWLHSDLPASPFKGVVDMNGLTRLPRLLEDVLALPAISQKRIRT